jgi:hypothetical protein
MIVAAFSAKRASNPPRCDRLDVSRGTSFADAETPEQRVEHILYSGAPCDPVERRRSEPKPFGEQD